MPPDSEASPRDWTLGSAKWFAVGVLSTLSVLALGWSVYSGRLSAPTPLAAAPVSDAGQPIAADRGEPSASAAPSPQPAHAPNESRKPAAPLARTININTATSAELELLPGIGPALAQRIIDERTLRGSFARIEDLDRVRGIGPKMLARLRAHVSVE